MAMVADMRSRNLIILHANNIQIDTKIDFVLILIFLILGTYI